MSEEKKSAFAKTMADKPSKKLLIFVGAAAVVIGGVVIFGGGSADETMNSSLRGAPNRSSDRLVEELPPAYEAELREADRQRIAEAQRDGKSALPTIIGNKVDSQEPKEITLETPEPEIVRPEIKQVKPVKPVVIPKPAAPAVIRPKIEPPRVEDNPVGLPPPPSQVQVQQEPEVRLVERPAPETNERLLQAYARKMAGLQADLERVPAPSTTQYFYIPSPEADLEGSEGTVFYPAADGQQFDMSSDLQGLTSDEVAANASSAQERAPEGVSLPLPGGILYGQMVTTADSDVPGAVVAEILQGDLAGSRLIGNFSMANEKLVIEFNSLTVSETVSGKKIEETFPISAVAVDTKHVGTAVASSVNRRLLQRVAITFSTAFVRGMGEAVAVSGQTSETNSAGNTVTSSPDLGINDQMKVASGVAAGEVGSILSDYYGNRPVTVKMEAGTPLGILFLQ